MPWHESLTLTVTVQFIISSSRRLNVCLTCREPMIHHIDSTPCVSSHPNKHNVVSMIKHNDLEPHGLNLVVWRSCFVLPVILLPRADMVVMTTICKNTVKMSLSNVTSGSEGYLPHYPLFIPHTPPDLRRSRSTHLLCDNSHSVHYHRKLLILVTKITIHEYE